jgi:hypothetical protein
MVMAFRASHRGLTIAASRRPASVSPEDRRVQIAAAKARFTLDKLTGDVTDEWITALSQGKAGVKPRQRAVKISEMDGPTDSPGPTYGAPYCRERPAKNTGG